MENIQNTSEVVITPKKTNIFKTLFFISLLIVVCQIVCIYSIINKYQPNKEVVQKETETSIITSTQNPSTELKAYTKSDDKKINLILNKNGEELIIDSLDKSEESELYKANFRNIKFSSGLTYLIYDVNFMETSVRFYNIKNKSFVKNGEFDGFLTQSNISPFITDDEKYIIFCSGSGYGGIDGGKIINTSDSSVKFDFVKNLGNKITDPEVNCRINNGKVIFSYNGNQEISYDLATSEIK